MSFVTFTEAVTGNSSITSTWTSSAVRRKEAQTALYKPSAPRPRSIFVTSPSISYNFPTHTSCKRTSCKPHSSINFHITNQPYHIQRQIPQITTLASKSPRQIQSESQTWLLISDQRASAQTLARSQHCLYQPAQPGARASQFDQAIHFLTTPY